MGVIHIIYIKKIYGVLMPLGDITILLVPLM